MDNLADILSKRQAPQEPPEIKLIKIYVYREFDTQVEVTSNDKVVTIITHDAALASVLRMRVPIIKKLIKSEKRLVVKPV